jgi:hypothetical protein
LVTKAVQSNHVRWRLCNTHCRVTDVQVCVTVSRWDDLPTDGVPWHGYGDRRTTPREPAAAQPRRVPGTPQQPNEYEQMLIRPVFDPDVGLSAPVPDLPVRSALTLVANTAASAAITSAEHAVEHFGGATVVSAEHAVEHRGDPPAAAPAVGAIDAAASAAALSEAAANPKVLRLELNMGASFVER